jgi:hypothetical protein
VAWYLDNHTMDSHDDISALIASARSPQSQRMIARSAGAVWPGGPADRTQPAALEWVRRWSPRHPVSADDIPACGCARGRCQVCN